MTGYTELEVDEILKDSGRAFLCLIDGEEYWIPKSQMAEPDAFDEGDTDAILQVTTWIAQQKGLA